ncbi:hypothetical protein COE15_06875 [Bacillus cereus]|nr:hypothetical protein CN288_05450 [Bacillus sp. AFS023182]PGY03001.1 hypothetical protein COE15_06875 [Bacillus cereus]
MEANLKEVVANTEVKEAIRKGPSPEAIKLLKAFLMRTSVPRIAAQRIREREEVTCENKNI